MLSIDGQNEQKMKIERLRYASTVLTLQVLLLPASLLIISVLLFWVTVPITFGHFLLALAVTVGISYLPVKKKKYLAPPANFKRNDFLKITGVFFLLILISLLVSMAVYDFSQEGQAYHQPGIIALANGWNPFHQSSLEAYNSFYKSGLGGNIIFVDHYTKASWITAASVYKLTGSIESGKLFNFLYPVAAFLIAWNFLFHFSKVPLKSKLFIALLTAMNPVTIYQLFSFYNDTQLASLLTVAMIAAFRYTMFREKKAVFFLSLTLLTLCNIKFTGLVYGAAIVGLSWLAVFIIDRDFQKRFVKYMGTAFLLAVVVIGYQPYITNLVHKGNPFYPSVTFAKGGNNVVSRQAPAEFIKKNRFSKLFYSLFSKSENRLGHMPRLKMPLSIDDSEMTAFNNVDARYGGFGPLFGTVLLIMIAAIPLLFKAKRLIILYTLIAAAIILISTLLNPEAWWARLAPQLWLLPVTFLVSFYYIPRDHRMVYVRGFVISLMFLNSLIIFNKYAGDILTVNREFRTQAHTLAKESQEKGKILSVCPDAFYLSTQNRLRHFNIKHRMVKALKPAHRKRLIGTPNVKISFKE